MFSPVKNPISWLLYSLALNSSFSTWIYGGNSGAIYTIRFLSTHIPTIWAHFWHFYVSIVRVAVFVKLFLRHNWYLPRLWRTCVIWRMRAQSDASLPSNSSKYKAVRMSYSESDGCHYDTLGETEIFKMVATIKSVFKQIDPYFF